ncbi:MAG: hypothetical protein EON57_00235 [Alphaproteobacteria bacterium]|nr:MAG: hypothetical protein EON57_00235 [Alphaproteobacteria bacterium]
MKVVQGALKLQYELLYVYEMLKSKTVRSIDGRNDDVVIAGYDVFDLGNQRVGNLCESYADVLLEAEQISKITSINETLVCV